MAATTYISDEMRALVGRETGRQTAPPIDRSDIRRWAMAVYHPETPPRLFWDEAYAATTVHGGIVAPEEFNPFAWLIADPEADGGASRRGSEPSPEGYVGGPESPFGVAPPPVRFQLNGGIEVEYSGVRMRPGDVITSTGSIADFHEREGRLGLMLFSVTESHWHNQRGELVKISRGTLIRY
ncbi:MAG: MaoC family dehydratase N-terminal domain-containing protein [Acidimicrobiia bacterium]